MPFLLEASALVGTRKQAEMCMHSTALHRELSATFGPFGGTDPGWELFLHSFRWRKFLSFFHDSWDPPSPGSGPDKRLVVLIVWWSIVSLSLISRFLSVSLVSPNLKIIFSQSCGNSLFAWLTWVYEYAGLDILLIWWLVAARITFHPWIVYLFFFAYTIAVLSAEIIYIYLYL